MDKTFSLLDDIAISNSFPEGSYSFLAIASEPNVFNPISPVILYPQNSYTDTVHAAEASGFYKVEVQLQ